MGQRLTQIACAALVTSVASTLLGCGNPKAAVNVGSQTAPTGTGNEASLSTSNGGATGSNPLPPGSNVLDSAFAITATAVGMTACTGNLEIQISAAFGTADTAQLFQVPQGQVSCPLAGENIDLAQLLKAFMSGSGGTGLAVADGVIGLTAIAGATYSPARPMLPSFIASTPDQLRNLKLSRQVTITTANGTTDTGTTTVQMVSYDQPYTVPGLGRTFPHTLDFKVTNTGFTKIDKVLNVLFDQMEFKISLNPIAILYLSVDGQASDYLKASSELGTSAGVSAGGILSGLPGGGDPVASLEQGNLFGAAVDGIIQGVASAITIHMEMNLTQQQGLDTSATATSVASDGEVIGGKPTGN